MTATPKILERMLSQAYAQLRTLPKDSADYVALATAVERLEIRLYQAENQAA